MREFILHNQNKTISFNLNTLVALATEPKGLGNSFGISYKETNEGKRFVNKKPEFEQITLNICFNADDSNGYKNYKSLATFLTACGKGLMLFEYKDETTDRYCEIVLKSLPKTEIDENGLFTSILTFDRQTYWYEQIEATFELLANNSNPTFPLSFPFGFLGFTFTNSIRVKNSFFEPAPITIKISGEIENNIRVFVTTTDNVVVSEVQLSCGNIDGRIITIDANSKKITLTDKDGNVSNGYNLTNKTKQSFLYLPQGEFLIGTNLQSTDVGKIEISIKRYLLD